MWSPCASVTWPCEGPWTDKGALGTPAWLLPRAALEASSTYTSLMGVGGAVLVWVLGGGRRLVCSRVLSALPPLCRGCGCHKAFTGVPGTPRRITSHF